MKEIKQNAVSLLILLLDMLVFEVTAALQISGVPRPLEDTKFLPSSHETVDLVIEPLDDVLGLPVLLVSAILYNFTALELRTPTLTPSCHLLTASLSSSLEGIMQ